MAGAVTDWFMGLGAQQQALGLTLVGCAGYLLCILLVWPLFSWIRRILRHGAW